MTTTPQVAPSSAAPFQTQAEEFLTLKEVASLLKVAPCSLYNNRRAGNSDPIPLFSVGRGLRARKSAILAWAARQEVTPIVHRAFKPRKKRKQKAA